MKVSVFAIALVMSSSVLAQADAQKCFSIKNNLDRKYCIDKYLETVKDGMTAEKKAWKGQIASDAKAQRTSDLETVIQMKKDQAALIASEVTLYEKHLTEVAALKETAPVVKKKKEKKKEKKKIFGIKL